MQGPWVKVSDPADASLWVARGLWLSRLAGLKVGLGDSGFKLHFSAILGFDIGWQKQATGMATWYSPVCISRYAIRPHWFVASRIEYYHDPQGGHIPVTASGGFRSWGLSGNIDWQHDQWLFRIETRYLQSPTRALNNSAANQRENLSFLLSISGRLQGQFH